MMRVIAISAAQNNRAGKLRMANFSFNSISSPKSTVNSRGRQQKARTAFAIRA
jgi:hypothetical protein